MATLSVPWNGVNAPQAASETVAPLDFSKLAPQYQEGVQFGHQQAVQNAFASGFPTDASGNPDFQAAATKMIQLGAPDQASQLMQAGIARQGMSLAATPLPTAVSPASTPASPVSNNAPAPQDFYSANHAAEGNVTDPTYSNGTASGVTQITQPTWDGVRAAHPELNLPPTVTAATADQQMQAEKAITFNNAGVLAQNGIPVTDRTARMAYFLGGPGAVKFFGALAQNGGAPAASIFPAEAQNNPHVFYAPDGKTPLTLAQVFQKQTAQFGSGNTTGFNFAPVPRNQVAGPGAPSSTGGPTAYAADGTPVATNAQGQAIDPRTGQPTQGSVAPRPNVHITDQPTGSAVMTNAQGQSMRVPASASPAVAALSTALKARAAQDGETVPGGAATATGGAAAANAASAAAAQTPGAGGFGAVGPIGSPGTGTAPAIPAPTQIAQGDGPGPQTSYVENLSRTPTPAPTQGSDSASTPSGATPKIGPLDPTLGGLVPAGVDPGAYAAALYKRAQGLSISPVTKAMGDVYKDQADKIMAAVTSSITSRSPALQEYQLGRQPGEGPVEYEARKAATIAGAEQTAKNANSLVETQNTPGGPKSYDTTANVLAAIKNGTAGANASVGPGAGSPPGGGGVPPNLPVAAQPAFIADRQKQIATDENGMMQQFQARQIAKERLGELANLTETYQTGDLAGAKAKAQALAAAIGIPLPNSATMNAASFEQFTKNAVANVFDSVKSMGGRVLVSEIAGLSKANANPEMQPGANAKIIAQGAGILNYEDQHTQDYFNWKHQNPNAYDTSTFEIPWMKSNPVRNYTAAAEQQIAPLGAAIPKSASDLKVGQVYQSPNGRGIGRWDGKQFIPETRPAASRLFPVAGAS